MTRIDRLFIASAALLLSQPVGATFGALGGEVAITEPSSIGTLSVDGTWMESPPPARWSHTAIYDPVRDRILIFGGDEGVLHNDVWEISLGQSPSWTPLASSGAPPPARRGHSAIYDPIRDRMIVFGGRLNAETTVWALTLADTPTWTELTTAGTPPQGRSYHSAIYDPSGDRMIVFGGLSFNGPDRVNFNDVWSLTLSDVPTWTLLAPTGDQPTVRYQHSAVYDSIRNRMIVYAGSGFYSDVESIWEDAWALSLSNGSEFTYSYLRSSA